MSGLRSRPGRWVRGAVVVSVIVAAGCKDEVPPDAGVDDAAAQLQPVFEDAALGVAVRWPASWIRGTVDPTADEDGVSTIAKAVRQGLMTPVPPRLVLTREPTTLDDPELAARRVRNVLEAKLEQLGARVRRISLSKRPINARPVGVLDVTYAFSPKGQPEVGVRHRCLTIVRTLPEGTLAIVTITATYLARDHDVVGGEVDAIFDSVSLSPPKSPESDRGG